MKEERSKKEEKERIREVSKKIKKCIREKKRTARQEQIQAILEELKGTKEQIEYQISKKANPHPKGQEHERRNHHDKTRYRKHVLSVLTQNYTRKTKAKKTQKKEAGTCTESKEKLPEQFEPIPEFTTSEIQDAIDRLKRGRAKESSGIRAEQIKNCSDETKETIRQIFNEILKQKACTPRIWRRTRVQVMYKKGDREDAGNYRPICSLPELYKLFATALYAPLAPSLHKVQPPDQGGFRPNHQTVDHLMVYKILDQRCREWGVPLYISTIDFTKAFDRIKHSALWSSLKYYGVGPSYVELVQRLTAIKKVLSWQTKRVKCFQ